ncbi:AAA family ATPase [Streptomyces sp. S1]|uniref:AAA family ATPase n=1 Tax=Streptomyces sp. S1 TaxID=718288 RepID=UPI003D729A12
MPSDPEQPSPVTPFVPAVPYGPHGGLLERDPELAAAAHAVDELVAGAAAGGPVRGGILVYRGEAGIGKTTLLREIRRTAGDRCTVLTARGGETLTSVPFHVTRQLLQPALDRFDEEDVRLLFGDHFDLLAPALGLAPPPPPSAAPADPQGVRDGLAKLLGRLADRLRDRPPVLLVDDAHWADAESLAWLDAFTRIRRDRRLPALVVLAHRPLAEGPHRTGVPAVLAALADRAVVTLGLHALTLGATAALARETLGDHADEPFCRELWTVTSGNPYETVELLAKARDRMLEPVAGSASLLRGLGAEARGGGLVARLEELGVGPTRLAWTIAVLGADSTPRLLASLTGTSEPEVAEHTELLRQARIVTTRADREARTGPAAKPVRDAATTTGPGTGSDPAATTPEGSAHLEFAHPLIASAIYGSMSPAARTAMHGQAAWALTAAGHGPAAVSRHLLEVHPEEDQEVVRQLRAAAVEHLAVGAPDAARRCLERALTEPPGPDVYATVLYELGCASLLTAPAATVRHLSSALDLPGLGDDLRIDATYRLAQALAHNNQLREAARVLAAEAVRTPPGTDRRRGNLPKAQHYLEEGLRLADRVGNGLPVHWDTACLLVDTLVARGRTAEARSVADRYSFGPPWPGAIVLPDGPSVLGRLLLAEGRVEEAVATLEAAAEALVGRGRHHVVWAPWPLDLARALAPTDPDRAAGIAAGARAHAERIGTPTALGEALRCAALLADPPESRRLLTEAVAHLAASPSRYEEARARLDLARVTGSRAALAEATALATACGASLLTTDAVTARASSHPPE